MDTFLFTNLDRLVWSAADLQRRIPIDPNRLQTLMKRHFPQSEAARPEGNSRRAYTGRMVIWAALTNELMRMGLTAGTAAEMTQFAFMGGFDNQYRILATGTDEAEIIKVGRLIAIAYPASDEERVPTFGLTDVAYMPKSGTALVLAIGAFLLDLAHRFENGTSPPIQTDKIELRWL